MQIELTVARGDVEQDVQLVAPDDAELADVLPALADAVGAPAGAALWSGHEPLDPALRLGDGRLRRGAVVRFGPPEAVAGQSSVLALRIVGGPAAGRVLPLELGRLTIGRAPDNDLVLADQDVSRAHAVLQVSATELAVHDLGSANGTWLAGRRVADEAVRLRIGDVVRVGVTLFTVAGPVGPPASVRPGPNGTVVLDRAPRPPSGRVPPAITLPSAAAPARPRGVPWITALLPAAAGGAIAWVFGQPEFLLFALLSPAMLISSAAGDRLHWRRSRRRAAAEFRERQAATDRAIADGLARETATRRAAAPDPADVGCAAALPDVRIWSRRRADGDMLRLRIGYTDGPSELTVQDPTGARPAGIVADVPLTVDLRAGPVGLAGAVGPVRAATRWLAGQLATQTAPTEVELALLIGDDHVRAWRWARWLPHLRGRVAVSAPDRAQLVESVRNLATRRRMSLQSTDAEWVGPWLVVLVDRPRPDADIAALVEALTDARDVGITAVWAEADAAALPACCRTIVRTVDAAGSRVEVRGPSGERRRGVLDQVSTEWADAVARSVAQLADGAALADGAGTDAANLPDRVGLLALHDLAAPDPQDVAARWSAATGGARAVLGVTAGGVRAVDLATDGPHALIAGTTGAGKSELLQTLVAGLALDQPPEQLTVLLVDYKGGAAFGECARLPHVAGLVTDLDAALTGRALRSLRAELRRRELLFTQAGAVDLAGYRAVRGDAALPRLVIVVDEFATLADELPDFVSGLVNVARRGRSLGLHLVLATQRPRGAVSPEIRANTDLRIALRVVEPDASTDVVDSAIAASIDRSTPGRGYLRAGAELTCFQGGHASGRTTIDRRPVRVEPLTEWCRVRPPAEGTGDTDLARLVDAVVAAADARKCAEVSSPWQPPLPDVLVAAELDAPDRPDGVPLGRADLPDEQRQATFGFDVRAGDSLLLAGASGSGRTAALVTLALGAARALSPAQLHLQVVDATGELARLLGRLPHCGTVLGPGQLELAPRLLSRLQRQATVRLTDRPGAAASVLVVVDGWDAVCSALGEVAAAAGADALTALLRTGAATGFAVAVTGDRSMLAPRFAAGFRERLALRLPDRHDPSLLGVRAGEVASGLPPGRAVRDSDGAVVQLAVAARGAAAICTEVDAVRAKWGASVAGSDAVRIKPLPELVRLADVAVAGDELVLGLAGDHPAPLVADPFGGARRWLIAGPPRSGRSTLLQLLAVQAAAAGIATFVAATDRSPLAAAARKQGTPVLGPAASPVTEPAVPTLVIVDDSEAFTDTALGAQLATWARDPDRPFAVVAAGRADDLATSYRGVAAEVRRHRCGVLLRPGPLDGELFGVRLPRSTGTGPAGRGVAFGDPSWGPLFADGDPVPLQVALP